jgi:flagellar protein FlaJ
MFGYKNKPEEMNVKAERPNKVEKKEEAISIKEMSSETPKKGKILITIPLKVLLISIAISLFLVFLSLVNLVLTNYNWIEFNGQIGLIIVSSAFIISLPQLFLVYEKYRNVKDYEEKLPIFLRDIIESLRSGMPFHEAVMHTSTIDYVNFSKEVKKVANQLSWGMPFDRVMRQFIGRMWGSKRIEMALNAVLECYMSGGDVTSTLESVADASIMLQESEKEKGALLNQYVMLMYAISFIFIAIVVVIDNLMVPIFTMSTGSGAAGSFGMKNPCNTCFATECAVCDLFKGTALVFSGANPSIDPSSIGSYYLALFFLMCIIEAACCGLVAGEISENSLFAGIKHSIIMLVVTFGAFLILVYLKLLGV